MRNSDRLAASAAIRARILAIKVGKLLDEGYEVDVVTGEPVG